MTSSVHPLEQTKVPFNDMYSESATTSFRANQQRAHSVTTMPPELQHKQQQQQQGPQLAKGQPWWQYYYQLYHYQLPPGRKPTVFGPYLLLQTLGEGEFGKVKFGIEAKTGQEVAIKLMRKDSIDSSSRMTKVEREISVLRTLHHPFIVELFDVIETEKYIGIILQCATGGELFDYILAHRYLKEKDASRLFAQLMSGVNYMHKKHIVHRDLKLENLLLDRNRNVLITDFGFANQFTSSNDDLMSTSCGSPCYAAPELVMNQGMYVGSAVDIWSCGVILFAMLCGYLPYDDDPENPESDNINLLYKYILNTPLTFPDYISDEACDLMSLMLVPDPTKRCGMDAIIHHPWLSAHKHLFEEKKPSRRYQQEDAVVPPDTPEPNTNRRNTIATTYTQPVKSNDTPSSSIKEQEEEEEEEKEDDMEQDQTVPDDATMNDIPQPVTTQKDALLDSIPEKSPAEKKKQQDEQHSKVPQLHTPRSRHMSLVPPESNSILQDKFISSIKPSSTASTTLLQPPQQSPVKPNFSISTPYPASKPQQNNKRNSHHNARLLNDQPPPVTDRGTRRKTLSLLVNSMTDNKMPFARRQSRTPPQPQQQSNVNVMSSVSEHTATLFPSDKDKHKSTGKKFMDWFKKKPNGRPLSDGLSYADSEPKLRTHHGAVDQDALTSQAPLEIIEQVKQVLDELGLEYKRENNEYKLRITRKRRSPELGGMAQQNRRKSSYTNATPFKSLLRRPSATPTPSPPPATAVPSVIYGDPLVDSGDEVRFSVEICRIKNLPGLYIVDMRRLRGNVWAYKFLYRSLMKKLELGGREKYLNNK